MTTRSGLRLPRRSPRTKAGEQVGLSQCHSLLELTHEKALRFQQDEGQKNPYTKQLKQPVTMRIDKPTIAYFKSLAEELGMPYQSVVNLYLRDCALHHRKLDLKWAS